MLEINIDPSTVYSIINFSLVFGTLQSILICKFCNGDVSFKKCAEHGLGFKISVTCKCSSHTINSCAMVGEKKNAYEINRRIIFVFRLLGLGLQGLNNFCGLMDFDVKFNIKLYYDIVNIIYESVKNVFRIVIQKAGEYEKELNAQKGYADNQLSVSGDGSWAKRGFSSLIGVISLICKFSNKVLDVLVLCTICKACEYWAKQNGTLEYQAWFEEHKDECSINHEGSAGKMEVNGIIKMFQRSE